MRGQNSGRKVVSQFSYKKWNYVFSTTLIWILPPEPVLKLRCLVLLCSQWSLLMFGLGGIQASIIPESFKSPKEPWNFSLGLVPFHFCFVWSPFTLNGKLKVAQSTLRSVLTSSTSGNQAEQSYLVLVSLRGIASWEHKCNPKVGAFLSREDCYLSVQPCVDKEG